MTVASANLPTPAAASPVSASILQSVTGEGRLSWTTLVATGLLYDGQITPALWGLVVVAGLVTDCLWRCAQARAAALVRASELRPQVAVLAKVPDA